MRSVAVEARHAAFNELIAPDTVPERVASGFVFTEGPVWSDGGLIFSDIPANRLHRYVPGKGTSVLREPSNMANGNTLDRQGRLLTCEHATSRVTRTEPDGRITVLASHYHGKELNSPNDIVCDSRGRIYFTDPTYGREAHSGIVRDCELSVRGVYRIDADGGLVLVADDFVQPNGLCFTGDGRQLFVNDSETGTIRVFDVRPDGDLSGGRVWATVGSTPAGGPDGMKIDSAGNLYACGPEGVHVFNRRAEPIGVVRLGEMAANMAWGDGDWRGLYVTASTSLYRIRVKLPGLPPTPGGS